MLPGPLTGWSQILSVLIETLHLYLTSAWNGVGGLLFNNNYICQEVSRQRWFQSTAFGGWLTNLNVIYNSKCSTILMALLRDPSDNCSIHDVPETIEHFTEAVVFLSPYYRKTFQLYKILPQKAWWTTSGSWWSYSPYFKQYLTFLLTNVKLGEPTQATICKAFSCILAWWGMEHSAETSTNYFERAPH